MDRVCELRDHLAEFALNLLGEVGLDLINLPELRERPATVVSGVVDAGNPVGFHRLLLLFSVFAAVALDLDDGMQKIVPGVEITAANTATGLVATVLSNEAGAYNLASLLARAAVGYQQADDGLNGIRHKGAWRNALAEQL